MLVRYTPETTKRPRLFFAGHGDGTLGTDEGADTAALAKVVIDLNVAGLLISGDAEIRAKIAAQVAAAAEIIPKAPARLQNRCLLVKTRFDMVKFFGVLLFTPAPDFQFTWFSHPDYLRFTAKSQRTQRKYFSELHSVRSVSPDRTEKNSLRSLLRKSPSRPPLQRGRRLESLSYPSFVKRGEGRFVLFRLMPYFHVPRAPCPRRVMKDCGESFFL